MDPKCAKYPKVVLGRPVEGRSCKLHGKAPLTGPYTPKWRPNDEEENATICSWWGLWQGWWKYYNFGLWRADTRPGSDDRGSLGADVISLPQPNSTAAEFLRRVTLQQLSAFYTNCNSIPVQIVQLFALPTLHVLITSLNPRAGFRQESCQLALRTIWMQFPDKSREIGNEFEILHLGPCPSERNLLYERYI